MGGGKKGIDKYSYKDKKKKTSCRALYQISKAFSLYIKYFLIDSNNREYSSLLIQLAWLQVVYEYIDTY